MDKKYILVSLEEEKSKGLAEVLSNDTSRKILSYLTEKNLSETDLARELNIPISTVHYNVQNLLKNNLVEIKDFLYSEKGNKINIYGITKKMIVIMPKGMEIKNLLPVIGLSAVAAGLIYAFMQKDQIARPVMEASLKTMAAAESAADIAANAVPNYALWFFGGAVFAIVLYAVINYIKKRV